MKRLFCVFIALLTISVFTVSAFADDTYEYNDFSLYNSNNTWYASGAFRSNTGGPMSTFTLTVDTVNNTWNITGGTALAIPFPTGITVYHASRRDFLSTAYVMVNNTKYNFSFIDDSGVYYCQNIPADPYYPEVSVYLPTQGTVIDVPPNPILSYSDGWLHWNTSGVYTEVYKSDSSALAGDLYLTNLTGDGMKIREGDDGYYYIRYRYTVNGEYRYTDYSNRVYGTYVQQEGEEPTQVDKIIDLMEDIRNGFQNATSTIGQFISSMGNFIKSLVSWLPDEVSSVFFAVVIIGMIIGIFIK